MYFVYVCDARASYAGVSAGMEAAAGWSEAAAKTNSATEGGGLREARLVRVRTGTVRGRVRVCPPGSCLQVRGPRGG